MKPLTIIFFILASTLFTSNISNAVPPQYQITDLGLGYAYSINNNGQVVGYTGNATLFDTTGQGNNINMGSGMAYSINDSGHAVGASSPIYPSQAMYYKPNIDGTYTAIGGDNYIAWSINNDGQMVGWGSGGWTPGGGPAIFTYDGSTSYCPSTLLDGFPKTGGSANSNNDDGQIVGSSGTDHRAAVWNSDGSGGYTRTTLGTISGYATRSEAKSINNSGQIVGNAQKINPDVFRAVLFDETGTGQNINLGSLAGYTSSWANSINDNSQIVGVCFNGSYGDVGIATLFDLTGGGNNIDLNTTLINPLSGWTLREAYSINEDGWIVGYMSHSSLGDHAFLLTAVPEPASAVLLMQGYLG
jgi:hypothetical protein